MSTPDTVRPARPADAGAIAAIQRKSWAARDPRLVHLAAEVGLDLAAVTAAWEAAAALAASGEVPFARLVVAVDDTGSVAGFAATGPGDDDAVELLELVVDPARERHGHGSRLLAAIADLMRGSGARTLQAWVVERGSDGTAEPGWAFLAGAGLAPDGAVRELEAADGSRERQVRLVADLT